MRLLAGKRDLRKYLLVMLISLLAVYPGPILPNIVQPVFPLHATAGNPSSSYALAEWNVPTPGAGPWAVTVDQLGKIWFTENVTNKLARFDPANNNFTEWNIPGGGNPRYVFTKQDLVGGRNVTRVYFTEYSSNKIGYFNSWNGTFYEWQLPTGSNPLGIFVDANYTIWFTESGRDSIGRLSPSTNQLTEWTLPGGTTNPGAPLLEPWTIYVQSTLTGLYHNVTDRYVWFTETANNAVGRLQITNSLLIIWDLGSLGIIPGLKYGPTDITVDSTSPGNVIFSGTLGDRISVLQNCGTTCTGYSEYALPSRNPIAKPTSVAFDSTRGFVWFTEYNTGIVAAANMAAQINPSPVPTSSPCVFPPSAGPVCPSPSGYSVATVTPIITNNVQGASTIVVPHPTTISLYQGPINGITEYRLPNSTSRPNLASIDTSGNIWITESNPAVNKIGRVSYAYDFQLTVSPTSQAFQVGQTANYGVTVSLTSGVPYPVQLTVNTPQGISASFNPSVGIPQTGNPFSSTLTLSSSTSTSPGTYVMNVTATSSGVTHTFQIVLILSPLPPPVTFDYTIDLTNAGGALTVMQGQQATFQFQISPSNIAPTRPVNLTVNQNLLPTGITMVEFVNANGVPPFSSALTLQTSITTPAGPYDLTNFITGLSTGVAPHHPRQTVMLVVVEVPRDFNMTLSSSAVNVVQASRLDLTVTLTTVGPFVGNVSLSGTFSPSNPGLSVAFSPSTLSPLPNGAVAQATMEIIAQRTTPGRTYQLTVTAISTIPSRTHQVTLSVHVSPCLIATATFESELAPEVQFLRDFRDQQILHTFAGSTFMDLFNSWYYSFSLNVAEYESGHATAREFVRVLLYPLIGILHFSSEIYAILGFQAEIGVLAAGILASSLIGFAYLSLPLTALFWIFRKRMKSPLKKSVRRWIASIVTLLMVCYATSEVLHLRFIMMFTSPGIVITFLVVGGIFAVAIADNFARRLK
jgi:streptogramin lyase